MSTAMRLSLKGAALILILALTVLASSPAPARACMWGVMYTYYYSTGGVCHYDCDNQETCWGDTSGYIVDSGWGECWYC
jgi:hypothetical protein